MEGSPDLDKKIDDLRSYMDGRVSDLSRKIDELKSYVDVRISDLDKRIDALDKRIDALDKRMETFEKSLSHIMKISWALAISVAAAVVSQIILGVLK